MKVSIIIPVYNEENCIRKMCNSIIRSKFEDWECIIIDDGSTDGTYKVCQELCNVDERVMLFHQENAGPGAARNNGLIHATGDYIMFCDADDELRSDAIYKMVRLLEDKNADFVLADISRITQKGIAKDNWRDRDYLYINKDIPRLLLDFLEDERANRIFASVWGKLFKKNIIDKYKIWFDEKLHTSEDELFCFQYMTHVSSVYYIHDCLYIYDRTKNNYGSSSVVKNPLAYEKSLAVIRDYLLDFYPKDMILPAYGNAYCEYAISMCYHMVRLIPIKRISDMQLLWSKLSMIIRCDEIRKNIQYYRYKNKDNLKVAVIGVLSNKIYLVYFGFKIQLFLQKYWRK